VAEATSAAKSSEVRKGANVMAKKLKGKITIDLSGDVMLLKFLKYYTELSGSTVESYIAGCIYSAMSKFEEILSEEQFEEYAKEVYN
jgi:hypothetical protein